MSQRNLSGNYQIKISGLKLGKDDSKIVLNDLFNRDFKK